MLSRKQRFYLLCGVCFSIIGLLYLHDYKPTEPLKLDKVFCVETVDRVKLKPSLLDSGYNPNCRDYVYAPNQKELERQIQIYATKHRDY